MRVFVTGATGFIGSAVVRELLSAGHQVLGLARSDAALGALARSGIEAHRGDLADTESLAAGARACEGVIHTAFIHDFSNWHSACETDRRAIEALGDALAGSLRPLVISSGTALVEPARLATEDAVPASGPDSLPRVASEQAAAKAAALGVRVSVVRLPPSVHGDGDRGFIPLLIGTARQKGSSAYVGEGKNRWPAVHRLDAAHLFRLALEKGAAGATYHGVADQGVRFREIAGVIGRRLNVQVVSKSPEEAAGHFGWFAHFAAIDNPTSSERTRELLKWQPKQPGLIADIDRPSYFES
jgi:nucleoside-diphosphate-sugar epimerase